MDPSDFFAAARERQAIYLRRRAGQPWPWTDDPVMRQYSITNVFRENDKTTRWFRSRVREPLRDKPDVLLATVLFRWFNRISTGEAIFQQLTLNHNDLQATAWQRFLSTGDTNHLRSSILSYCGKGPYVTGSYIILGQQGMPKLDGVLKCLEMFYGGLFEEQFPCIQDEQVSAMLNWKDVGALLLEQRGRITLEQVWAWLRQVPYLGDFMAYEIVTDLRHTALLDRAPDVMTWANPGPGAARGLARVYGREIRGNKLAKVPKRQMIGEMCELLALSRDSKYWPQWQRHKYHMNGYEIPDQKVQGSWPAWELHEVEMWACELNKIMKARLGEGRPRGVYRPS